jgi:hypothetical protein
VRAFVGAEQVIMVQGYYSLNEAARALGMSPDELRAMAQRNQIRSFQDRGTLRFRLQDVQELARRRGASSDADLMLAGPKTPAPQKNEGPKSAPPKSAPPKSGGPKSPKSPADAPEVFSFDLDADDKVDLGAEVASDSGSKSSNRTGKKLPLPSGSDSDVKLVPDKGPDSDVRLVSDTMGPKTPRQQKKSQLGPGAAPAPASPAPGKSSRLAGGVPQAADSGVRLTPTDSDSDVKIVGAGGTGEEVALGSAPPPSAADSDIRLERVPPPPPASSHDEMQLTDEINLDEEIKKQEAAQRKQPKSRVRPKSELKFPSQSPFELSDDMDAPAGAKRPSSSDFELTPKAVRDDSSDFDLTPAKDSGSVVLEPDSADDLSLELPADNINVGGSGEGELTGPTSGISLSNPVDAGISLEEGATDEVDLDLSLEPEGTPAPAARQPSGDTSSEFELSLEEAGQGGGAAESSEFELTLDDSASDLPLEPQKKAKGEKDIFETDFEVPALEGESGSEVAALQTSDADLESSDFDLALDDSDLAVEDESGSQVVALDEESADEAAETIAGELGEELEIGEEDEEATGPVREVVRERLIEPAPWGALPVVFMLPCVIVMLMIGIMGFEMVQSSAGFKSTGFLTRTIGGFFVDKMR